MKKLIGFLLLLSAMVVCLTLIAPKVLYSQSEFPTTGTVVKNSNLRAGPGTNSAIVGSAKTGQVVTIVEKNGDGSWYHLESGEWIANFLVKIGEAQSTPAGSNTATPAPTKPVTATVAAPTVTPVTAQPTATPTPAQSPLTHWSKAGVQVCNGFEWQVVDVRTAKEVWFYDRKRVAMGQYLLIYTEIKNVGSGTNSLDNAAGPTTSMGSLDVYGSSYAAWMMTGGHNVPWEEYNPGDKITVVEAYDVDPSDGHLYAMYNCLQAVDLGEWAKIKRGAIKAN